MVIKSNQTAADPGDRLVHRGWPSITATQRWWVAGIVLGVLTLASWVRTTPAQQNPPVGDAVPTTKVRFANNEACVTCHFPKPGVQGIAQDSLDFVQTTPSTVWQNEDKHRQAFLLLLTEENSAIVENLLGFSLRDVVRDGELVVDALQPPQLARLKQCLTCHAAWPIDSETPPVKLDQGVSCQACHGPGFDWYQPHQDADKVWRLVSPREKEILHMTDVRDPATRARLCASCHVGDLQQQRFVTHEMYALGHPPLPSFELESFARQMPPHWRMLREKPAFALWDQWPANFERRIADWLDKYPMVSPTGIRPGYRQANYRGSHDPRQDLPQARSVVVGAAAVFQSYLTLLADHTAASIRSSSAPEFSLFDCTACHHELSSAAAAADRPVRMFQPGRPPIPMWPASLVRAGVVQLAGDGPNAEARLATFEERLRRLETAVTRQPFGDPQSMHDAATALAADAGRLAERLSQTRFDVAASRRAIRVLTESWRDGPIDYHTARQLAWAIRRIAEEVEQQVGPPTSDSRAATQYFQGPDGKDRLSLALPAGQTRSVTGNLKTSLLAIATFDPSWFQAELDRIRRAYAE